MNPEDRLGRRGLLRSASGRNDALSGIVQQLFVGRSNHDPTETVYAASSPFPGESKASHFPLYDRWSFPCR